MLKFNGFEKKVIELLTSDVLSDAERQAIFEESRFSLEDDAGAGYFLTAKHPILPNKRNVCDDPRVIGELDGVDPVGFVIFIQDGELTLESYSWSDNGIPADFRERDVKIRSVRIESGKFVSID
jgi:hypothetical protein